MKSDGALLNGLDKGMAQLYERYNHKRFVHPDPLEFLYAYDDIREREIVAFVASALAYGRVTQILASVQRVLDVMGDSPLGYVLERDPVRISEDLHDFRHRFTTGAQLATLFLGLSGIVEKHGAIGVCFATHLRDEDETVKGAMEGFVKELSECAGSRMPFLLPSPADGSACKRFCLMLRWMVRRDEVDPGGWDGVPPRKLIIPVDTHMFSAAAKLGLTERKTADFRTALEITAAFRVICPDDPCRYDFSLTRLGIRPEADRAEQSACSAESKAPEQSNLTLM